MADLDYTYANIVNLKMTQNELLLEFGVSFRDGPQVPGTTVAFDPAVRIVMAAGALEGIHNALAQAIKQREAAKLQVQQPKVAKAQ